MDRQTCHLCNAKKSSWYDIRLCHNCVNKTYNRQHKQDIDALAGGRPDVAMSGFMPVAVNNVLDMMDKIINLELKEGYEQYKKAYEIASKENEDLKQQSQKDRELLKEIQAQCSLFKMNNKSQFVDEIYNKIKKHLEEKP